MLTAEDVEQAFVDTAHEQEGGPFDWRRVAHRLNEKLADQRDQALAGGRLMLQGAK